MNEELDRVRLKIDPLKAENKKLMQDNNELDFKIIKINEDIESTRNTNLLNMKKLEAERSDLRFTVKQKDTKINKMESEN
jgi:centrosomal protein CEP135